MSVIVDYLPVEWDLTNHTGANTGIRPTTPNDLILQGLVKTVTEVSITDESYIDAKTGQRLPSPTPTSVYVQGNIVGRRFGYEPLPAGVNPTFYKTTYLKLLRGEKTNIGGSLALRYYVNSFNNTISDGAGSYDNPRGEDYLASYTGLGFLTAPPSIFNNGFLTYLPSGNGLSSATYPSYGNVSLGQRTVVSLNFSNGRFYFNVIEMSVEFDATGLGVFLDGLVIEGESLLRNARRFITTINNRARRVVEVPLFGGREQAPDTTFTYAQVALRHRFGENVFQKYNISVNGNPDADIVGYPDNVTIQYANYTAYNKTLSRSPSTTGLTFDKDGYPSRNEDAGSTLDFAGVSVHFKAYARSGRFLFQRFNPPDEDVADPDRGITFLRQRADAPRMFFVKNGTLTCRRFQSQSGTKKYEDVAVAAATETSDYRYPSAWETEGGFAMGSGHDGGQMLSTGGGEILCAYLSGSAPKIATSPDDGRTWKMIIIPGAFARLTACHTGNRIIVAGWNPDTNAVTGTKEAFGSWSIITGRRGVNNTYTWSSPTTNKIPTDTSVTPPVTGKAGKSAQLRVRDDGVIEFAFLTHENEPRILECRGLTNAGVGRWV